jgi:site-specific DNA recombinase
MTAKTRQTVQKDAAGIRAAIYARYSSDLQRESSIKDQARVCRERIERDGGRVVETYSDAAISGARASNRPGLQKLLADAKAGRFDTLYAEALDRLSRDQEDVAGLFKRLRHADVRIVTLSEGEISELHVGLKGTMNQLFLKDLAAKIRRGQRGAAEAGRAAGGRSYGHDVVRKLGDDGEVERGLRKINEREAAVVRRIFAEYVAGRGPKAIAGDLNREGIPAPRGGAWSASTINGHKERLFGILTNPLYNGELVFNRVNYKRDPDTGRREIRTTEAKDWVRVPAPELRIVDPDTWKRAQELRARFSTHKPHDARRPRHLLSGLVRCAVCSGPLAVASHGRLQCTNYRERATCTNSRTVPIAELQSQVLASLREKLWKPGVFDRFVKHWVGSRTKIAAERDQELAKLDREDAQLKAKLARMADAIAEGLAFDALTEKIRAAQDRLRAIADERARLSNLAPVVEVSPDLAAKFQRRVEQIERRLFGQDTNPAVQAEAREQLRALIGGVLVTPGKERGEYSAQLMADVAEVLALGFDRGATGGARIALNIGSGGAAGGN